MRILNWYLYRLKWFLARWINFKHPIHIDIELNTSCNLKCPICHQTAKPRPYKVKQLPLDEAKRRVRAAKDAGALSIKLNWRGEPLVYKHFFEVLEYTLSLNFVDVMINTNLSVKLTEAQTELLAKVNSIKVSIDSILQYDIARKGGNLEYVMQNITNLICLDKPITVNVRPSDVYEGDVKYLLNFYEWIKAFYPVTGFFDNTYKYHTDIYKRKKRISLIKFNIRPAQKRNTNDIYEKRTGKRKYCAMPSRRLTVAVSGKVFPCCVPYAEPFDMQWHDDGPVDAELFNIAWSSNIIQFNSLKRGKFPTNTCRDCVSSDAWK